VAPEQPSIFDSSVLSPVAFVWRAVSRLRHSGALVRLNSKASAVLTCAAHAIEEMQQWEDWNRDQRASDFWLYLRLLLLFTAGLTIPFLLHTWHARRKEAPVEYRVAAPEGLRGWSYDVNASTRSEDEVGVPVVECATS
jgi:hypothetical protein